MDYATDATAESMNNFHPNYGVRRLVAALLQKLCFTDAFMKIVFLIKYLVCGAMIFTGGCATMYKLNDYNYNKKREDMRFWATKNDLAVGVVFPPLLLFALVDLPFSLATDTIMFPFDQYYYSVNKNITNAKNYWIEVFKTGSFQRDKDRQHLTYLVDQ